MPRKHPDLGVEVMTSSEFFEAEAAREGRSAAEVMAEMFISLADEEAAEEAHLKEPETALHYLRKAVERWNEYFDHGEEHDALPVPVEVLQVLEASYRIRGLKTTTVLKARVRVDNGKVGVYSFDSWHHAGTYVEPPEADENLLWEADRQ
jgi:hypothetical protein